MHYLSCVTVFSFENESANYYQQNTYRLYIKYL